MAPLDIQPSNQSIDSALRQAQRLVNRYLLAIFIVVLVIATVTLSLRYVEATGEGRRNAGNLADLLSEYVVIRLRGVDGALSRIGADNRRLGGPSGSDRDWPAAMRAAIVGIPGLSSLVILDENGIVQHATVQQIQGLSWADRPVFQELAKGIPNRLFVGRPVTMVAGDQVLVPFGRALTDPLGDFNGAVVALILPNQLRDFLGTFDLGQSGVAWVLLPSGDVLFQDGATETLDGATGTASLFAEGNRIAGDGLAEGPLKSGGADYLTAYRQSDIADLIVAVSIADRTFLRQWQFEAAAAFILCLALGGFLFFSARRINAAAVDIVAAADNATAQDLGVTAQRQPD